MKYARFHEVDAEPMTLGEFTSRMGRTLPEGEPPDTPGYLVVYPDGYKSWCPKDAFEDAGRPIDGMTFGMAIEAMKRGKKVARRGWNGKGMYLLLGHNVLFQSSVQNPESEKSLPVLKSIVMRTAQGQFVVGWLASQSDMLCEDWAIVE